MNIFIYLILLTVSVYFITGLILRNAVPFPSFVSDYVCVCVCVCVCVVAQSCLTLWDRMDWDYMDCTLPGSSVRWNFPGDLELSCHFLLQGILPIHPNTGIEPMSLVSPTLAESHLGSSVTRVCVCVCVCV